MNALPRQSGYRAEEAVLDLVPLARARREVAHGDLEACLVGELLQLESPERTREPLTTLSMAVREPS